MSRTNLFDSCKDFSD